MFRYPYQMHECPVCGRPLEVRDEYLGRRVACPHCRGRFIASEATMHAAEMTRKNESLLSKADQLLRASSRRLLLERMVKS